jgi:IclR family transcriptional regulator, KDG regulon repressor
MAETTFKSLEQAIDILCSFDAEHPELTAQEISTRVNMRPSSTYRYLDVLLRKGFLTKNGTRTKYKLGLTLFRLGNLAGSGIRLVEAALPYMKELAATSRETILLTVLNEYESVCLEKIEAQQLIKLSLDSGSSLPLHTAASSRILLAYQNEAFVNDLVRKRGLIKLTANTITDPVRLKAELEKTRDRGYAVSMGEADPGAAAIGAPIFDHQAKIAGGLTIAGPAERIGPQSVPEFAAMVTATALEISRELGYEGGRRAQRNRRT